MGSEAAPSAFERAFAFVVGTEGGYVDNPADPGGPTKFGISHAAYPTLDITSLTLAQAQAIYQRDYWDKVGGDALPPPLALLVFDAAVNNGPARAIRWLQLAVGVHPDGLLGPATQAAIAAKAGAGASVMAEFQAQRTVYMAGLSTWQTFGLGWARRLCLLPYHAIQMEG
jgi:lysozyme family protein